MVFRILQTTVWCYFRLVLPSIIVLVLFCSESWPGVFARSEGGGFEARKQRRQQSGRSGECADGTGTVLARVRSETARPAESAERTRTASSENTAQVSLHLARQRPYVHRWARVRGDPRSVKKYLGTQKGGWPKNYKYLHFLNTAQNLAKIVL